ncbi:hypothetical protein HMSSN139_24850 [Paenibacillus sp. HMSSN-139]|nr:hypothetical protein HMSSN139_24850 [Paenibacillus sp. HMSSN-139]
MDNQIRKPDGFDAQKLFVQPDYMLKELNNSALTRPLFVSDIGFFPQARHHFGSAPKGRTLIFSSIAWRARDGWNGVKNRAARKGAIR